MSARRGIRAFIGVVACAGLCLPAIPLLGLAAEALAPSRPSPFATGPRVGLVQLFVQSQAPTLMLSTLALALVVSLGAIGLGTLFGWMEQRARYPGVRLLGVLCLVPMAMPSYVLAGALRHALGPGGLIGRALGLGPFTGFWPAALTLVLATTPYVQLLVAATLTRVPAEEEEAARTLGASPWRAFTTCVLPRLRPAIAFAGLLTQLYVISDFGAVAMLDCPVLTWRLYRAVDTQQLGEALALGIAVLATTLPLLLTARAIHGRSAHGGVANPRPAQRRAVATWIAATTIALQAFVVGVGVIIPIASMTGWVLDANPAEPLAPLTGPLLDTLRVAVLGGMVTLALAIAPAWFAARAGGRRAWLIEQAAYLTSALPGVLLAFGLLVAALGLSRTLSGGGAPYYFMTTSGLLLVAGYATRFLAEAFTSMRTAVIGLDRRQEESARVLGASAFKRWSRITLPALLPGTAVALLLVVLSIIKELPVTLLLGGAMGLRTLSFRMFDRYNDAFLADAGAAGLVLVGMSLGALVISLRWRHHV